MVTKFSNIIHEDGLDDLLLRLKCSTCTKNTNKIGEEASWQAIKSYNIFFSFTIMLLGETKLLLHIPCCHLCCVASGVMAELGGGNSCQINLILELPCWHVLFKKR